MSLLTELAGATEPRVYKHVAPPELAIGSSLNRLEEWAFG